ncbi:MAG: sigma-70 family RNA polymerase sigma factor [Burkholderiales bacterium]
MMVQAHTGDIYRFAYWLCRDRSVAEDLVQETFARAWANWETVRDEKAAKGWLLTICHHEHVRLYEKKRVEIDDQELDEMMHGVESKIEASYEMREALWLLPEQFREPLLLQVLGGFSCAEIGDMVGISENSAMQRVTRARKAMRQIFGQPEISWGKKS